MSAWRALNLLFTYVRSCLRSTPVSSFVQLNEYDKLDTNINQNVGVGIAHSTRAKSILLYAPGHRINLCCSQLFPSYIPIAGRPYPPSTMCRPEKNKYKTTRRRLSPSHAVIIISPIVVHSSTQGVLTLLPSSPSALCSRSCFQCQCYRHHHAHQYPSNACSSVSMRHSYCRAAHSSWCSGWRSYWRA